MRWPENRDHWTRRFALLPVTAGGETIWLEWYWAKFCGEYTAVEFSAQRPDVASQQDSMGGSTKQDLDLTQTGER